MTFDKIVLDAYLDIGTSPEYVISVNNDATKLWFYQGSTGSWFSQGSTFNIDGVNTATPKNKTRQIYTMNFSIPQNGYITFMGYFNYAKGVIYNIKIYNGTTLVAHY